MNARRLFFFALTTFFIAPFGSAAEPEREWRVAGGDSGSNQYSLLDQINKTNVHRLEQAWIYHCGDADENNRSQIQCNPIVAHGTLYGTSPKLRAIALDAATGEERWTFDPFTYRGKDNPTGVNRGVVFWEAGDERRILFTAGHRLFALDARSGTPIETFGTKGVVDLRIGLGRDPESVSLTSNTPGAIYEDLLILGTRVGEGPGPSAPGFIRAYDVRDGSIRWTFHTIPQPGEFGYDTWPPEAHQYAGGANAWSGISVDRERGLVVLPTGSAAFDFWGGNRKGANLFANCVLTLDARNGLRLWHYQIVHHDLWDRDLPAAPNLVQVELDGRKIDAVAQVTKSGHVFVFDRVTGDALFPIEERPVPPSDLLGEEAWPTQPFPLVPPPFSRQRFTEDEITDISPESHAAVKKKLGEVRTGEPFTPPSEAGTVIFPGFDGGAEWGGAAWDPDTGHLIVNANEMPWILTMVPVDKGEAVSPGEEVYRRNCLACHGVNREGSNARNVASLHGIAGRRSKAEAAKIVKDGQGFMPPFGFLSEQEREQVTDYLFEADQRSDEEAPAGDGPQEIDESDLVSEKSPYTHTGYNRFFDPEGYPAVKPPWGTLNAIDLNAGEIRWTVRLGEFEELTKRGIPQTGTENYGGPVVTRGGLIFIAATQDEKFRAFDKHTGEVLWETDLPAGGYATPCTYEVNGVQYVAVPAGGGKMGTKSGDAYVAFRLGQ